MVMGIDAVPIGATVKIGSLTVNTPYILSFNVRRQRGQISTFDASLKVSDTQIGMGSLTGSSAEIYAGQESGGGSSRGSSNQIFGGLVKKATMTPCFDDPSYTILNVSGEDILSQLKGKKFTRRCKGQKSSWVTIDGVSRKGLKSSKFKFKKEEAVFFADSDLDTNEHIINAASLTTNPIDMGVALNANELKEVTIVATPVVTEGDS